MPFKEKNFQSLFTKYAKKNPLSTGIYELKLTKLNRFNFARIEEQQIASLLKAKHKTLVHKISDTSYSYLPGDTVIFTKSNGFVVIMFYKPYKKKKAYVIDIDLLLETKLKQKSITEEEAKDLASSVIDL